MVSEFECYACLHVEVKYSKDFPDLTVLWFS